ncbi:hypothetical protein HAX54_043323 [Datura stramonium]|uniref:Uncharacterized protein n=1 Tax=Datura stramonium TaxID=4076 RepID=A0ABS8W4J4_DATST|nr:hypothetical protein [Datura stramonium]
MEYYRVCVEIKVVESQDGLSDSECEQQAEKVRGFKNQFSELENSNSNPQSDRSDKERGFDGYGVRWGIGSRGLVGWASGWSELVAVAGRRWRKVRRRRRRRRRGKRTAGLGEGLYGVCLERWVGIRNLGSLRWVWVR